MAVNNYVIEFTGLRLHSGNVRQYAVHIQGGSGSEIALKGAASPIVTEEDDDDDIFTPIRTQTGYIRIVDDGKAADGVTAFDWKDLIPTTDTERPVTLTTGNTVLWQGFIQAQTFDGPIYNGPTEREFPIQCVLSALDSIQVETLTGDDHIVNFYGLIYRAFSHISSKLTIGNFYIEGGTDAYIWLLSKFDWQNLLSDNGGTLSSVFSYQKALEDMCRFWGFTMRTEGTDIYLTMTGASDVTGKLTMTLSQILSVAGGGTAGTITNSYYTSTGITAFANTEQDETILRGYNKAIVKADCNKAEIGIDFNEKAVEEDMGNSWVWAGEQDAQVGYFYTNPPKAGPGCIQTDVMNCSSVSPNGQFMRIQVYSSPEDTEPVESNVINIITAYDGNVKASIETVRSHRFGVGSLEMTGDIYHEYKKMSFSQGIEYMVMRIGIGKTRATAKWFYLKNTIYGTTDPMNPHWDSSPYDLIVFPKSGTLCIGSVRWKDDFFGHYIDDQRIFAKFPTESGLEGKIFVDFLGSGDDRFQIGTNFMIANFKLKFTRNTIVLPYSFASETRQARMVNVKRQSSYEYKSSAWGKNESNWSADCIYASDNNMEYGFGLLMNNNGSWLEKASYNGQNMHPEAHLAAAVTTFWQSSHKLIHYEMQDTGASVRPDTTIGGGYPIAISHDWRDDVIKVDILT